MSRGIEEKIVNSERKQGISIVWDGDGNHISAEMGKERTKRGLSWIGFKFSSRQPYMWLNFIRCFHQIHPVDRISHKARDRRHIFLLLFYKEIFSYEYFYLLYAIITDSSLVIPAPALLIFLRYFQQHACNILSQQPPVLRNFCTQSYPHLLHTLLLVLTETVGMDH